MTDSVARWARVQEIFHTALERTPAERDAFLREACGGDHALRAEVDAILLADEEAGAFAERPALEALGPLETTGSAGRQLQPGDRLGPYTIEGWLGAGGMGEVYRARDGTLGRDVALKILPRIFNIDPERRARFDREARLLAALNHPHVGAIYGVVDSDGIRALVLELVDGDTLADWLAQGPIPIDAALPIARQIADALEAAHEKGIVHRDLKPANIKITPDGSVKVLDFGLAKAASVDGSGPDLTQSQTGADGGTREGVLLGTAAYMSPEQARGKPVDKRTDIWAFACVLYEMLTGRAPFAGDTITDTLATIVERDPSWSALPAATPATVQRLLRRCLVKDPKGRLHDIADARIELDDVHSGNSVGAAVTATVDQSQTSIRWRSIAVIASLLALIAVGAPTWYVRTSRHAQTAPRLSRLTIGSSGPTTPSGPLAFTPDGTRVVYVGNNTTQLFVRPLDQRDPTAIATAAAPINCVFVSPDGQWVGFVEGATLKKVLITGGPAVTITSTGNAFSTGATWAPDGTIIFASFDPAAGLHRVSADGGEVSVLTRPDAARGERDHLWPEMLPGGRAVLYTIIATTGGLDAAQVAVFDLATGTSTVLVRSGSHARYVSGHLLYTASGTLKAVSFDLARLNPRGTPVTVLPRLATAPQGGSNFDVSADGSLAYLDGPSVTEAQARTLVWVDRQSQEEPLHAPPRYYFHPRVSPDGTKVAVHIAEEGSDIWVWDLARQKLNQLTFGPAPEFNQVWTPDGHRLVFMSPAGAEAGLFWRAADGTGAPERLGTGLPSGVTPDGKQLLFSLADQDVMVLTLDGTNHVEPLIQTSAHERNGVVSSDGRWLAYESDSSGKFEIYVRPFPNVNDGQWLISTAGGTRPLWAARAKELFYVGPDGALMAVRVDVRGGTWAAGGPAKVVEGPYVTQSGLNGRTYDVSADGQRFLMVKRPAIQAAAPQINVDQNWFEDLNRLAPPP